MIFRSYGDFGEFQSMAQWCLDNGVEINFVAYVWDMVDDMVSPMRKVDFSCEDVAQGRLRHSHHFGVGIRICEPIYFVVRDEEVELFDLRFRGIVKYAEDDNLN